MRRWRRIWCLFEIHQHGFFESGVLDCLMLVLYDGHNFADLWVHFGFIDLALFLLVVRQRRGRRGLVENNTLCANDTALWALRFCSTATAQSAHLLVGVSSENRSIPTLVEVIRMNGTTNATRQATWDLSPLFETKESRIAGMTKLR